MPQPQCPSSSLLSTHLHPGPFPGTDSEILPSPLLQGLDPPNFCHFSFSVLLTPPSLLELFLQHTNTFVSLKINTNCPPSHLISPFSHLFLLFFSQPNFCKVCLHYFISHSLVNPCQLADAYTPLLKLLLRSQVTSWLLNPITFFQFLSYVTCFYSQTPLTTSSFLKCSPLLALFL